MYITTNNKMATEKDLQIIRQNQSSNVRELLKETGLIQYLSTYEIMVYVELWTDYCTQGITPEIKQRFQSFDNIIEKRKNEKK
jgi:hypothetical protein